MNYTCLQRLAIHLLLAPLRGEDEIPHMVTLLSPKRLHICRRSP